jgi:translation initiation factor 2 subunit 2
MDYEKMLDRLYASLPESTKKHERFELPPVDSFIQGKKTIVRNFPALLKAINRDGKHLFKFIAKETATSAAIDDNNRLVLSGKFDRNQVNGLVESYVSQFILCPECKRPDTHVAERQGIRVLKCEACGATSSVKGL